MRIKEIHKSTIDFRKIKGDVSTFDRYKMAQHLVSSKPSKIHFVGIATEQQTFPVKMGEIFATDGGVDLKITENETKAYSLLDVEPGELKRSE